MESPLGWAPALQAKSVRLGSKKLTVTYRLDYYDK
jgi:hypothetical protein